MNQARKEIAQRYDFKGSCAAIEFNKTDNSMALVADDAFKMEQVWDIRRRGSLTECPSRT